MEELKLVNFEPLIRNFMDGDIPELLLIEVLIRIHPMIVCRFKLVSKKWLSLISDTFFVRRSCNFQASLLSQPWTILSCNMAIERSDYSHFSSHGLLENLHSQSLKPSYCVLPLPSTHKSKWRTYRGYRVYGVSNGLVLYGAKSVKRMSILHICNPVTGQWIALPPCYYDRDSYGFVTHVEDGILKSFRVVKLTLMNRLGILPVEVFYPETGKWKRFPLGYERIPLGFQRAATDLNGVLHWITCKHGLLAYDPYQNPESKRLIPFPHDIIDREHQDGYYTLCDVYQGKLRLIEVDAKSNLSSDPFSSFKIWVLDDYSSGDWCLHHAVNYTNIQYDVDILGEIYQKKEIEPCHFVPVCFHPFDSDIVFFSSDDELVSYSIKKQKIEIFSNVLYHPCADMLNCAFLFKIPTWPVSIPHHSFGDTD